MTGSGNNTNFLGQKAPQYSYYQLWYFTKHTSGFFALALCDTAGFSFTHSITAEKKRGEKYFSMDFKKDFIKPSGPGNMHVDKPACQTQPK